jgi:hypothetical protein
MRPTLVILAAGMASRYGSMKQVEGFGPNEETIMDYSIYDAIRTGFGKVVFVIRRDFAGRFKEIIEPKLKGRIELDYVFQEMDAFTQGFNPPPERTKPWGTAHAVLSAKDSVNEPFAVINADDFYGKDAFKKASEFLGSESREDLYAIIGYELAKTLSEHGSVSRGVCKVDKNGFLISITERTTIYRGNGKIIYEENGEKNELNEQTPVSMNFFCFHPSVFGVSEKFFLEFLEKNGSNPKAEFFIPIVADQFIRLNIGKVKVIPTSSQWFGVTYKEDAPGVRNKLKGLIEKGEYPEVLWD